MKPAEATPTPSPRRLVGATIAAAGAAVVILVVAVLPAEYGIDPIGAGGVLGLVPPDAALVGGPAAPVVAGDRLIPVEVGPTRYFSRPFATDTATFQLGPYDYVEYKYRLEQGASVTFAWKASAAVIHDLHAEPDGAEEHAEISFDKRNLSSAAGTHTAPFAGLHGWMWENPGSDPITVTITTAGFYSSATEFRPNRRRIEHQITRE
jgi:hypothetical protein